MKFSWFAYSFLAFVAAASVGINVWADPSACNPSYDIKYSSCVTPDSRTVIRNVTTDWILVNKGATRVTDGPCIEHIQVIAQEHPKASNIKFVELDDKPNLMRGWGKRDIYCKYSMEEPMLQPQESPLCGIKGVERQGCADHLSLEFVKQCLNAPTSTDEELWKKAACLVDAYLDTPRIKGLDSKTYDDLFFELSIMKNRFAKSPHENERRIAGYVGEHFKEQVD